MSASTFETKIRARFKSYVYFCHDGGTLTAIFPVEQIRIVGNYTSNVVTANWGDKHCAQFVL